MIVDRQRELISVREGARRLGIEPRTLRGWLAAGRLPAVRLSARCVRIDPDDLAALVAARKS